MRGCNGSVPRPCRGWGTGRRALRGYEGRTETPLQNSQRVLLPKPSTAAMSRHGRCSAAAGAGRPGRQSSRPTATGYGRCASWRRDGDIAPYRNGTRAMRELAARWGHRALPQRGAGDARVGGAMGTSRPTATGHGRWGRTTGRGATGPHHGARGNGDAPRGAGQWGRTTGRTEGSSLPPRGAARGGGMCGAI